MMSCWSCGSCVNLWNAFCKACDHTLPATGDADYFQVFDLPPSFAVNVGELEKRFKTLQLRVHPDLFARNSEAERVVAADASALLNRAYQTLRHPSSRAQYMLQLKGREPLREGASTAVDPALLMEVMEARESIPEVSDEELAAYRAIFGRKFEEGSKRMAGAFAKDDLDSVERELIRMQYYSRVLFEMDEEGDRRRARRFRAGGEPDR